MARTCPDRSTGGEAPNVLSSSDTGLGDFKKAWKGLCNLAEVEDCRWHDLRATYITRLIEAGMPIELVAKLSGHTQLSTLYRVYLRLNESAVDMARKLLDGKDK